MGSIHWLGLLMILTFLVLNGHICSAGKVSAEVCSKDGTECNTIANSACDVPSLKCKCIAGFKEDSTDGSTCVEIKKVSEVVCPNGGSECNAITHSACATTQKCKCDTGYGEDTNDGSTCVKEVDSTDCTVQGTECSSIGHAECDSTTHKCKCSDGFKMNADKCIAADKNAGVSATLAFIVLALPVTLSIKEAIM
ncbi:cell death abnormality protein 1-like [Ruditapes philippinarum]|uniref:cell death abnormality protein 1-like n=1 Tax=Ruditapes philippinarum TaxID=129788 RepID=UPI00295AF998|nr:cell death abnormality protein 1-like [Ruditapes philippinarum]